MEIFVEVIIEVIIHYLNPRIQYSDYFEIFDAVWQFLVERKFSFIIKDDKSHIVGVALNFLLYDVPEVPYNEPIDVINDYNHTNIFVLP